MYRLIRSLVLAGVAALPVAALAGPPQIYHHVSQVPAQAGGTLRLELGSQDVKIAVQSVKTVTVTVDIWARAGSDRRKADIVKRLAPEVSTQGGDVIVRSPPDERGWHFGWGESPRTLVTVVIPTDMNVKYRLGSGDFGFDNPDARTAIEGEGGSGDAVVKSSSSEIALQAGSGDLTVSRGASGGEVKLEAGSGDINFSGSVDSLSLRSGSGDIDAEASAGNAMLRSGSGDLSVQWHDLAAGTVIDASTGSGDVTMTFPASTVLGGRLSTGSGDVESEFPATLSGSRHVFTLAGGANAVTLDASTGSGDLILHKRG